MGDGDEKRMRPKFPGRWSILLTFSKKAHPVHGGRLRSDDER
jgi:hypothetical protein